MEDTALMVRRALKMGAVATEEALTLVAKGGGDTAVEKIVQGMTPGELMTVVGDFDMTKPSMVSHHMTTAQFLDVVDRIGLFLSPIEDRDYFRLDKIQSRIESILIPSLAMGRDVFYQDRLEALLNHEGSASLLALLSIDQQDYEDFIKDPQKATAWNGTWQEIFAEVAYSFPNKYEIIVKVVDAINEESPSSIEYDEEEFDPRMDRVIQIINSLVYKAKDLMVKEKPEKREALVFVDL